MSLTLAVLSLIRKCFISNENDNIYQTKRVTYKFIIILIGNTLPDPNSFTYYTVYTTINSK